MDGFQENDRIIVIGATNLSSTLDQALLRPGRFDHKIEVRLPNTQERSEILGIHLKKKKHTITNQVINFSASITEGMSGAELEGMIN